MADHNFLIIRKFAVELGQASVSLMGSQGIRIILEKEFPGGEIKVNSLGKITIAEEHAKENIRKFLEIVVGRLVRNFGYAFSENSLESVYNNFKNRYGETSEVLEILGFLPEGSLEKEKIKYLTKSELEQKVLERTRDLQELNANLEKTVVERTKELVSANNQLEEKNKELEELSQAKTAFVSLVSHQLRSPLTAARWAVAGLVEAVVAKEEDEIKKLLDFLLMNNGRMTSLVDNLLNVARIEENRLAYEFKRVEFGKIVKELIRNLFPIAEKKLVTISYQEQLPSSSFMVMADKEKLYLAVENILDNAIKYTLEGGKIEVKVNEESSRLIFCVRDYGVGIPKEDRAKIFSKFFRAKNVSRDGGSGSGLGLFITKKIIEDHGGEVYFKSEEGSGTTFFVELPLVEHNQ